MSEVHVNRIQSQSGLPIEVLPGIGYTPAGAGAVARNVQSKLREFVSVKDFGAVGDGATNDTAAINAAIAAVSANNGGGSVFFPRGNYVTTSTIYVPKNIILEGEGFFSGVLWNGVDIDDWGTCIVGKHTGAAIVSFKGAYGGGMRNMSLYGWSTTPPKTGLCLGRAGGAASSGRHLFERVNVTGHYSKAAIYSIASEESSMYMLHGNVLGGGAQYTFYTSGQDDLAVDSLVTSSNWNANAISGFNLLHQAGTANSAAICINVREGTSGWAFTDGFTGMTSGPSSQHILINLADAGDESTDFAFENVGCEAASNASPPTSVFRVTTSAGTATLKGLKISGCSMGQFLGGTQYYLDVVGPVTLEKADISGSNTKHPSRVFQVSNSNINLPDQDLLITGATTNSTLAGKSTFRATVASTLSGTESKRPIVSNITYSGTGPNDLSVSAPTGFTNTKQNVFIVTIDGTTAPNTFRWSRDGGATFTNGVPITAGTPQLLADGCYITIVTGTGHTMSDQWAFTVDPFINRDTGVFAWTPVDASGAGLSFTVYSAQYTKIGRLVTVIADIAFPTTASGANAEIGGLPFPYLGLRAGQGKVNYASAGSAVGLYGGSNAAFSSKFNFVNSSANPVTNASLSGAVIGFTFQYFAAY